MGNVFKSTGAILKEDVAYRWYLISVFIFGFSNFIATPAVTLMQVDVLQISAKQLSVLTMTGGLVGMVLPRK